MKTAPLLIALLALAVAGCSRSVKAEDSAYGAAYRKAMSEQQQDAQDFSQASWKATEEIRKDGKASQDSIKKLQSIIDQKKAHYEAFAAVKPSTLFAEYHTINLEFMKSKLDIDTEQVGSIENGDERQMNRMTDKIEKAGLDYQAKMKACMAKLDKVYVDRAMASDDEFR